MRNINEECGVFGIFNHKSASSLTYFALHSLQHRGQEAAGIISSEKDNFYVHRDLGLVSEVFKRESKLKKLVGNNAIGHVRYSTSGNNSMRNVQPFLFEFYDLSLGICHNGNLINAESLRVELEKQGAIFHSNSDTEVLIHLIRRSKKSDFKEKLKESLNKIRGGFTYLLLTEDTLYGAVDPNSLRPLVVGKMKNGAYVMASDYPNNMPYIIEKATKSAPSIVLPLTKGYGHGAMFEKVQEGGWEMDSISRNGGRVLMRVMYNKINKRWDYIFYFREVTPWERLD